ncbi:unnamed protein product [Owenia fusiformis]|uniref:Uncharacterized protein n=1 Tax=Owenia fusiformis TaxID=6347 RepID=A0A8J1TJZ2_OWEFU|nr:unnamed protein product [Owenia fusiformis]
MTNQDYRHMVPELREKFQEQFADQLALDAYDERDVERFNNDDVYAHCFMKHHKGNIDGAVSMVDTTLKFRKELEINDLTDKSFPAEWLERGGIYYHNHDKDGHPIMFFRIKFVKKDPQMLPTAKKFLAYWMDKHHRQTPDVQVVVLMDMTDAGLSNMDLDLIKFLITCFTSYYPYFLAYLLMYEMPWILNAVWRVIQGWLSERQREKIKFVKKADIQEHINKDNLPKHMGGTDTYEYKYTPPELEGNGDVMHDVETSSLESSLTSSISNPATIHNTSLARKRVTFSEKDQYTSFSAEQGDSDVSSGGTSKGDTLLSLNVTEEMEFNVIDPTRETKFVLVLSSGHKHLAFKVKTTSPERYRVKPSSGLIKPDQSADVNIFLQPGGHTAVSRDKFLIMGMEIADDVTSVSQVASQWKTTPKEEIEEYRLRCVLSEAGKPSLCKASAFTSDDMAKLTEQMLDINKKLTTVMDAQTSLEKRLKNIYRFQIFFFMMVILVAVAVTLVLNWNIVPLNRYNVNSCIPSFFQ